MTQEQFIQKWGRWLPYTDRDKIKKEMNDDLDLLIEGQEQKIYICSPCNNCDGNGLIVGKSEMEECPICKGKGFIREQEKPAKEERELNMCICPIPDCKSDSQGYTYCGICDKQVLCG